MREARLPLPELFLIAATRGMLGIGLGLLMADRIPHARRNAVGAVLATFGAISSIPLALRVFRRQRTLVNDGELRNTGRMPRASA